MYSVRHEGSPHPMTGLSAAEVVAGLRDEVWEGGDEVRADNEPHWHALEDHPQFAEAVAEYAPPPPMPHEDETRLDMNPLIDVALVLLIFFILTASYETVRKVLDLPGQSQAKNSGKPRVVPKDEIKQHMIYVTARAPGGRPVLKVEGKTVAIEDLDAELTNRVRESKKTVLLLDATPDVEYGVVMAVMDAARGARIERTLTAQGK